MPQIEDNIELTGVKFEIGDVVLATFDYSNTRYSIHQKYRCRSRVIERILGPGLSTILVVELRTPLIPPYGDAIRQVRVSQSDCVLDE